MGDYVHAHSDRGGGVAMTVRFTQPSINTELRIPREQERFYEQGENDRWPKRSQQKRVVNEFLVVITAGVSLNNEVN